MKMLQLLLIAGILACNFALAAPKAAETADDAVEIVPDAPKWKRNAAGFAGARTAPLIRPKPKQNTKTAKPRQPK